MHSSKVEELVDQLDLQPHPEGGFFKETYRSKGIVSSKALKEDFNGDRCYCTGIYFLLTSDNFSAFHRIKQDEMWHYYEGSSLHVHIIDPSGNYQLLRIGNQFSQGQRPQGVVPAGSWFASEVASQDSYSLVGCTVAPGFDFDDFELADRSKLSNLFPQHEDLIERLTRS